MTKRMLRVVRAVTKVPGDGRDAACGRTGPREEPLEQRRQASCGQPLCCRSETLRSRHLTIRQDRARGGLRGLPPRRHLEPVAQPGAEAIVLAVVTGEGGGAGQADARL